MRHTIALFACVVLVGCEPAADENVDTGSVEIAAFLPSGRVDCSAGCAIDLGDVVIGTVRETPLQFTPDGVVVVTALRRDGCTSFSARPPGELLTRATTSIRLVSAGAAAGACVTTFDVVTNASNSDDGVISVEVQATLVDGAVADNNTDDIPR